MYRSNTKERLDTKAWAKFWGVSVRTIQNWLKDGQPVERPLDMANLILRNPRPAKAALSKAHELIAKRDGALPADTKPAEDDRNFLSPSTGYAMEAATEPVAAFGVADLVAMKDKCGARMARCESMVPADMAGVTYWHGLYLKTLEAIKRDELHLKKMGLDDGQIISRAEFDRLLFAMGFWMLRSVDVDLKALAPKCVGLNFAEESYGVLDRYFVRTRFFSAFSKSITQESGVSLPLWAYDSLKAALETYWETDKGDPDDVAAYAEFEANLALRLGGGVNA